MMLNVKKMKKNVVLLTTTAVIAIGVAATATASWSADNMPNVELEPLIAEQMNIYEVPRNEIREQSQPYTSLLEYTEKIDEDENNTIELPMSLVSVKRSDEHKFTPEEWQGILSKIESGEIYLEDE